ncbi:MAG: type II secretion system F family protein [Aestuariivirga sp.]
MDEIVTLILTRGDVIFYGTVFASVVLVTFAIANMTSSWSDVRRRTVAAAHGHDTSASELPFGLVDGGLSGGMFAGLMPTDEARKTELTRFLNTSGYYGNGAVIKFQLLRLGAAIGFGMITAMFYGRLYPNHPYMFAVGASLFMTLLGYMLPRTIVSLGRDKLFEEHRQGFPDFLDLLVICVEAGVGIDSAIERVGRDLSRSYPSLSRNLRFMSLELRAGRSTREALENLSGRLGIEEARSFAMLIQQSEELGSSLVQSLRVYSDEMRAKRLSRAEEKAHSLPVKLVLPLALFIFPVILGITLMPVAMKLFQALKI